MGNCSRKHQGVFCFSASSLDDEANAYRGDINPESPHYLRWRHHRRVVAKILGLTAVSALKRSKRRRKESGQPSSQKGSDSTDDDDRRTASILSTAISSNSSFFSIASSPSFRSTPDATEQKPQRKQAPPPGGPEPRKTPSGPVRTSDSGIAIFLLIGSLVVMVFWGRFLAILWTSSWLFFIACWCYARGTAAAAVIKQADECTLTTELRRRWMEEAEEKKRVVRRGLLERNRRIRL